MNKSTGWNKATVVAKDVVHQMRRGQLQLVANSLAFSTALAIIPFLVVVLATFKSIGGFEALYPKLEVLLLSNLKEAAGGQVTKMLTVVLKNLSAGKIGTVGAIFLFFASMQLLGDMEKAFHTIWGIKNTRPFYKRFLYQWAMMLVIPIVLAVYIGFMSYERVQFVSALLPTIVMNTLIVFCTLFCIHKFVPNIKVNNKVALISALINSVLLIVVHKSYIFLVKEFFNYNKVYGSFAAFPLLLLWIITLWYVILGCAAFCASLQYRANDRLNQESYGP